jgi:C4-dicarboxylate transporter DctQ subunit
MTDLGKATALRAVVKGLDRLGQYGGVLATLVTWLLAVTVTYDVILRSLGIPTLWAAEVSIYLMIAMAFFGVGATQSADGHFRVSFVRDLCPRPVRTALDVFALLLSLLFAVGFTYGVWKLVSFTWMLNFRTSTILQLPMWMLQGLMLVGGVLLILATLRDLIMVFLVGADFRDRTGGGEVI